MILDELDPSVKRNVGVGAATRTVAVVKVRSGRALCRVVKLDEEKVKRRVLDSISKVSVRNDALWCSGDIVGLGWGGRKSGTQGIDHG